jgi:hypothetical protein
VADLVFCELLVGELKATGLLLAVFVVPIALLDIFLVALLLLGSI